MTDLVTVTPLPAPLSWDVAPASLEPRRRAHHRRAAPHRCVRDPAGSEPQAAAPRLLGPVEGDFQLSARVNCTFEGAFDAGALLLWADEARWVKLALEISPDW